MLPLADLSTGSSYTLIMYAEVALNAGSPDTYIYKFDQYYFVLKSQLTIKVTLQKHIISANTFVVFPASIPHYQYNHNSTTEKHIVINTPTPKPGRYWDYSVVLTPNGINHYGNLAAASKVDDDALLAG